MSEEVFVNEAALEAWLISKDVPAAKAEVAAKKLYAAGFDCPSALVGISSDDLKASGLPIPLAQSLRNKLATPQQNGKLRCCRWLFSYCCILVCC
jgi:hypothetical protein